MDLTMTNHPHLVLGVGHLDRPGVHQLRSQVLHLVRGNNVVKTTTSRMLTVYGGNFVYVYDNQGNQNL